MTKVALKFANFDAAGKQYVLDVDPTSTVGTLKARIIEIWPAGYSETPSSGLAFRTICMGKSLDDDKITLQQAGIPLQLDYPTPIHVMPRPAAQRPVETQKAPASVKTADSSSVCCVIM